MGKSSNSDKHKKKKRKRSRSRRRSTSRSHKSSRKRDRRDRSRSPSPSSSRHDRRHRHRSSSTDSSHASRHRSRSGSRHKRRQRSRSRERRRSRSYERSRDRRRSSRSVSPRQHTRRRRGRSSSDDRSPSHRREGGSRSHYSSARSSRSRSIDRQLAADKLRAQAVLESHRASNAVPTTGSMEEDAPTAEELEKRKLAIASIESEGFKSRAFKTGVTEKSKKKKHKGGLSAAFTMSFDAASLTQKRQEIPDNMIVHKQLSENAEEKNACWLQNLTKMREERRNAYLATRRQRQQVSA